MAKQKIVLDAITTDNNLSEMVKGAFEVCNNNSDILLYMVGPMDQINEVIKENNYILNNDNLIIIDAQDKITNEDIPTFAIRNKKESSLYKAYQLLKENDDINGFVSAGSTGAILCGAIMNLKTIGKCRPALSSLLPNENDELFCLIDCGANVDCHAKQLVDYAKIGNCYMQSLYPNKEIRVGLVSNGSEDNKGNILTKEVFGLLKETNLNFVGNIEGNDILADKCDVLVCDGFVGNVVLKNIEGTAKMIIKTLYKMMMKSNDDIEKKYLKKAINDLVMKYDLTSLGGATLLGVNKVIMKGHGNANSQTVVSLVSQVFDLLNNNFLENINKTLTENIGNN